MISYLFLLSFTPTINDKNEQFPADVLKPELTKILRKSGTFYDFSMDTISTCTIGTLTVT